MITGKTIMSWNVPSVMSGDPENFTKVLVDNNFEGVCLKAADGTHPHEMSSGGPWWNWGENIRDELMSCLREAGLKVYFWHFLYGRYPIDELGIAREQCDKFKPDGYIWDPEATFENTTRPEDTARMLSKGLAETHPHIPQALCWWAFPISPRNGVMWHPVSIAEAFLEVVSTIMPMMYWDGDTHTDVMTYLKNSLQVWRDITDKPICPIGRCYNGNGGYASPGTIKTFATQIYSQRTELNLVGTSWFSLDRAFRKPDWMMALAETPIFGNFAELTLEEKVDRLVSAHMVLFPELQ